MLNLEKKLHSIFMNRFNHLLVLIVALLLAIPFARSSGQRGIVDLFVLFVFAVSNILILRIMIVRSRRFWAGAAVLLAMIIADSVVQCANVPWADRFVIVADIAYAIFLVVFLRYLTQFLFNEKKVTDDSIKGGICTYLLLGVTWGLVYRILLFFDPKAFLFEGVSAPGLFYFSYVTLTTVGYGDIVPATHFAQTLAFLEAVTGQMFIAIFIARLMGLHIAHVVSKKDEAHGS
jgi:voltage-gated potassium channel Kch